MVMIGNVDQVLALVRNQLDRMAREKRTGKAGTAARASLARSSDRSRMEALSRLSDIPSEEFEQILVGALLAREFGEEVAQDPRFQSIVDRTCKILRDDPDLRAVMRDAQRELQSKEERDARD